MEAAAGASGKVGVAFPRDIDIGGRGNRCTKVSLLLPPPLPAAPADVSGAKATSADVLIPYIAVKEGKTGYGAVAGAGEVAWMGAVGS